jgi:pimeloyl-ACP methyl ester carboxylesterase
MKKKRTYGLGLYDVIGLSPSLIHDRMKTAQHTSPLLTFSGIALTGILAGALIGATTNAVNGYVSPTYFQHILGWDFPNIWAASIIQGVFEGLLYGLFIALVFGVAVALMTRGQATYGFAVRHLLIVIGAVYLCWTLGGLLAMGLAALSPDVYRAMIFMVPEDFGQMLRYAWVGGSIWGGMIGGVVGLSAGIVRLWTVWEKQSG